MYHIWVFIKMVQKNSEFNRYKLVLCSFFVRRKQLNTQLTLALAMHKSDGYQSAIHFGHQSVFSLGPK